MVHGVILARPRVMDKRTRVKMGKLTRILAENLNETHIQHPAMRETRIGNDEHADDVISKI